MEPERLGSLSADLRSRVNGEYYRFASRRTLRLFRTAPTHWCGLLRDPVTGLRFYPTARSPRCEWGGAPYFFRNDSTRREFLKAPKKYEVVRSF